MAYRSVLILLSILEVRTDLVSSDSPPLITINHQSSIPCVATWAYTSRHAGIQVQGTTSD